MGVLKINSNKELVVLLRPPLFAACAVAQSSPPESPQPQPRPSTSSTPPTTAPSQPQTQPPAPQTADPAKPDSSKVDPPSDTPLEDEMAKFAIHSNEVNVVFTVTDKHGKQITDLKQGDFQVLDDNRPVEQVRSFRAETNLPLQVGLLIDASNSVRDRFKFEQESAIEFLNQAIRLRYDHAFVVGFDATPE